MPGRGSWPPPLSSKQKAAPIARPSYEYEKSLAKRSYGDETEKESREAERQREAEERQKAREAGVKVDLGTPARYWQQVAEVGSAVAGRSRPPQKQYTPKAYAGAPTAKPPWPQKDAWESDKSDKGWAWSSWKSGAATAGASWEWNEQADAEPPASARGADQWSRAAASSADDGDWQGHSKWNASSHGAAENRWSADATAGGAVASGTRDFSAEEKAKRAAARQAQADMRRRARGDGAAGADGDCWTDTGPVQEKPDIGWATGGHDGSSFDASDQAAWRERTLPTVSLANQGLHDEEAVARLSAELARVAGSKLGGRLELLDLSGNRITDAGLKRLLEVLCQSSMRCARIWVSQNHLSEPHSVIDLLWDHKCGLEPGASLELGFSVKELSKEVVWRLCEVCCKKRPRPPLRLCLSDGLWNTFYQVINMAERRGLTVQRGLPCAPVLHEDADIVLVDGAAQ